MGSEMCIRDRPVRAAGLHGEPFDLAALRARMGATYRQAHATRVGCRMTTPQLKAIQRHHHRAYQARVQFMRDHGIALTPREQVEAQREEDRIRRQVNERAR